MGVNPTSYVRWENRYSKDELRIMIEKNFNFPIRAFKLEVLKYKNSSTYIINLRGEDHNQHINTIRITFANKDRYEAWALVLGLRD